MSKLPDDRSRLTNLIRRILLLGPHTCPWWFAFSFDNPIRQLVHDPAAIFGKFVTPGQTVVDIGCGLGYFSLALARLVGPGGKVIAVDVQPQMIQRASRRAEHHGLAERINFITCSHDRLGITEPVDFALAFWVVHEVAKPQALFHEVNSFLKPDGCLLVSEPKGHVSAVRFAELASLAQQEGFVVSEAPPIRFSRSVVCTPVHLNK